MATIALDVSQKELFLGRSDSTMNRPFDLHEANPYDFLSVPRVISECTASSNP